jgi:hypothetical protein
VDIVREAEHADRRWPHSQAIRPAGSSVETAPATNATLDQRIAEAGVIGPSWKMRRRFPQKNAKA